MDLMNVLESRRSIRSFTGEAVSEETRKKLLFAANASPVGLAKYDTLHLTVIRDPGLLEQIERNTAAVFQVENRKFLYNAPELILISTTATDNVGFSNAAILAQDMALVAVNEGVGACHIWGATAALCANAELLRKLNIPDGFTPACAVAVGETEEVYARRDIPENRISVNYV